MSSAYPPYGSTPNKVCQRCGASIPPEEVYCGNCGFYNASSQGNNPTELAQPSSQNSWAGTTPPTTYDQRPFTNPPWGQPSVPPVQNTYPSQPSNANSYYPMPNQAGNYGQSGQQVPFYSNSSSPVMPGVLNAPPPAWMNPPEKRRTPKTGIVVGIILLIVILAGATYFAYPLIVKQNPPVTHGTPTAVPTTTIQPLFADAFNSNANNWDLQGDPGKFSVAIKQGTLILEDDNHEILPEFVPVNKNFSDFKLVVDAALTKGDRTNGYGVYIRGGTHGNDDLATNYRLEFYGDGVFAIFKGVVGADGKTDNKTLVNYTDSTAIKQGTGLNHIVITAQQSTITLSVNGQTLKTITDTSYTSGSIALFVSNLQNVAPGAQATFSNLAIYPLQA